MNDVEDDNDQKIIESEVEKEGRESNTEVLVHRQTCLHNLVTVQRWTKKKS